MQLLRGIALLALLAATASAKSTYKYDQRQQGKLNVQINAKNVSIIALVDPEMLEDYVSYDYAYDYADFTIKPKPTTSTKPPMVEEASPANTEKPSNASTEDPESANAWSSESVSLSTTSADDTAETTDNKIIEIVMDTTKAATEASSTTTTEAPSSPRRPVGHPEPRKKCPVGFLLKSGRCFKRRLSLISPRFAMMKLAPALLSKATALTRNLATDNS